jgi:hypothetical protein
MRLTAVAVTLLLTVTSCSKPEDSPVVAESVGNPLLAYAPSDSAYLVGNLAPVPDAVIDRFLERAQPVLIALQSELGAARTGLQEQESTDDRGQKLGLALLDELDGNLSRSGLEKLGFSLRPHLAVYGMGAFPVIRIQLSDPQALRDTLQRLQDKSGFEIPQHERQGKSYWRISDDHENHHGGPSPGAYLSIQDDHLAMSIFPTSAEEDLLPAFLGLEMPADSNAVQRLTDINKRNSYQPYATGVLDLHKLADVFLNPDPVMLSLMSAAKSGMESDSADAGSGEAQFAALSEQCETEVRQIIDHAPRMVMGTTELGTDVMSFQYRVETEASLASELAQLVSGIPLLPEVSTRVFEIAFGIKVGAVRDLLMAKARSIADMPFQCEKLQDLNSSATQLVAQLEQPIPPFVNNFLGIRASMDELPDAQFSPEGAKGVFALHVDKPEMFVGMAQMFLPDLAELDLTPGSPPVQIPESLAQYPGMVAWAALSNNAIGVAVGENEKAFLPDYLDQPASKDGTVLMVDYDSAAYLKLTRNMRGHMTQDVHMQNASMSAIAEAAKDAYKAMAGRNQISVKFASDSIVIDNRMTFK